MAIIVEEKRSGMQGLVNALVWVVILGVVIAGVYYIFFKNPELVEYSTVTSFQNVQQLSKIVIHPDEWNNNPQLQALKQYTTTVAPQNVGRSNPFLGF